MSAPFTSADRVFPDRGALVAALTSDVAAALQAGLAERGVASLAASGGSSPEPLYQALSREPLDWAAVTVALVDERWVAPGEAGSNETFVRRALLHDAAASARFIGLKTDAATPAEGEAAARAALAKAPAPFDAVVLGLGADGHTASWFPHAEGLARALDPASEALCVGVRAQPSEVTGELVDRMTLTLRAVLKARFVALMIAGEGKRAALTAARAPGPVEDMPVRAVLRAAHPNLHIYWAP